MVASYVVKVIRFSGTSLQDGARLPPSPSVRWDKSYAPHFRRQFANKCIGDDTKSAAPPSPS